MKLDSDEPPLHAYENNEIQIKGQTEAYAFLKGSEEKLRYFRGLVVSGCDKILISWQLLMEWGSIPKTFPYPTSSNNSFRIEQGKSLEDVILEERRGTLNTDTDADIEELEEEIEQKKKLVIDSDMK